MTDTVRLHQTIYTQIIRLFPELPETHQVTLTKMLTGLLQGKHSQLSQMARYVNYTGKKQSLVDRFRRFMTNKHIAVESMYAPIVAMIMAALTHEPLILAIDSTKIGGNCICLMVSIHYKSRALPLAWVVFKGKKGHCPQEVQLALLQRIAEMLPAGRELVLLGDGEFDGSEVVSWLNDQPTWHYVCRTSKSTLVFYQEHWVALQDLPLVPEQETLLTGVIFTQSQQVTPVNILVVWHQCYQEHWFFVTNYADFDTAKHMYHYRYTIETLFSDVKGRGFHVDKTKLWRPERVNRLLMVVAIGYVFSIFLGVQSIMTKTFIQLVRSDRFQHSLFQLGLIYLQHLLNEGLAFPETFSLPPPTQFEHIVLS
jgi:hypothetical protein